MRFWWWGVLWICAVGWGSAQPTVPVVRMDTVWVGQGRIDTVAVTLSLPSDESYRIVAVRIVDERQPFTVAVLDGDSTIVPGEPVHLVIRCLPRHNLWYRTFVNLTVRSTTQLIARPVRLEARCYYADSTYRFTWNLQGSALVSALYDYVKVHRALFYSDARRQLFEYVAKGPGDTIECVYSGRKIVAKRYEDAYAQGFNTEHVWPRSYGADREPAKSDLHHLFPSDQQINEKRANYPFGLVSRQVLYEQGGSRLGYDAANHIVFEVRPQSRGDIARAMFYFALRYRNPQNFLSQQEAILRQWHQEDPVDSVERHRNQRIRTIQYRPNPFIDHPEFLERIYQLGGNPDFPPVPAVQFADSIYHVVVDRLPDTAWFPLFNIGTAAAIAKDGIVKGYRDTATVATAWILSDTIPAGGMEFVALRIDSRQRTTKQWQSMLAQEDTITLQVRFRNGIRPVKVPVVIHQAVPTSVPLRSQQMPVVTAYGRMAVIHLPDAYVPSPPAALRDLLGRRWQVMATVQPQAGGSRILLQWNASLPSGLYWYVVSWNHRLWIIPVDIRP